MRLALLIWLGLVTLLSLASPADALAGKRRIVRESPFHYSHYAPGESSAIDGSWESPSGERVRIQRGRAWDVTRRYGIVLEQVMWKDIVWVAPGRYRALGTGCFGFPAADEELTLSVISTEQIVLRTQSLADVVYTAVGLDDATAFRAEHAAAVRLAEQPPVPEVGPAAVEIHRMRTHPAMLVAPGGPFDLVVDYTVTRSPTGEATVPVRFAYSILRGEEVLFVSTPSVIEAAVGRPLSRTVQLTATEAEDFYTIVALLEHAGAIAERESSLLIGDSGGLLRRLEGKWRVVGHEPSIEILLVEKADGLSAVIPSSNHLWRRITSTVEVEESGVVWRLEEHSDEMNCSIASETTLTFGESMDQLIAAPAVVGGGWCAQPGRLDDQTWV
ncbi:MAG: hypothetical protein JRJ84_24180, partial [Deltaproteobacteria bacterium]|nr:hypothetical protein [Deltaproteobacteria bacterium]